MVTSRFCIAMIGDYRTLSFSAGRVVAAFMGSLVAWFFAVPSFAKGGSVNPRTMNAARAGVSL